MKRIIILATLFFSVAYLTHAQQVTEKEAELVALNELIGLSPKSKPKVAKTLSHVKNGHTLMYEVVTTDRTSVLVSGHFDCTPILATFQRGSDKPILDDYDNLPDGLQFLIDWYLAQLDRCFSESQSPKSKKRLLWKKLMQSHPDYSKSDYVEPLIQTKWGQSLSNDKRNPDPSAYNCYIAPRWYNDCEHPKAGCGAVAMAQVMKYYNYPVLQSGRPYQYNWCDMSNELKVTSTRYSIEKDAVGRLVADCAEDVTLPMGFGCEGTYSVISDIKTAMIDTYGYNADMEVIRQNNHTSEWWKNELKSELRKGRPIIYSGATNMIGANAHFFICDGFDQSGRFHFNWGRRGNHQDIYCEITNIHSTKDSNCYDWYLFALFYIEPALHQEVCNTRIPLDLYYSHNVSLSDNAPAYKWTPTTMTAIYSASANSPAAWRTIPTGAVAVYQAHEEVMLQDGFEAMEGCEFEARIEPCAICEGNHIKGKGVGLSSDNVHGEISDEEMLLDNGQKLLTDEKSQEFQSVELFPNPTEGPLTIAVDGPVESIAIFNFNGQPVGGWDIKVMTETVVTFDVSALRTGSYLLSVVTPSGLHSTRFIRR